jgi:hypothetical protein
LARPTSSANRVTDSAGSRRYGLAVRIRLTDLGYDPDWGFSVAVQMNTDRKPMTDRIGDNAAILARVVRDAVADRP